MARLGFKEKIQIHLNPAVLAKIFLKIRNDDNYRTARGVAIGKFISEQIEKAYAVDKLTEKELLALLETASAAELEEMRILPKTHKMFKPNKVRAALLAMKELGQRRKEYNQDQINVIRSVGQIKN